MSEDKFYPLDMINIEVNRLGAKQQKDGLDPMDIAIFEKLIATKVKILTELIPTNDMEGKRIQVEINEMLVENLLSVLNLKPIEKLALPKPKKLKKGAVNDKSKDSPKT